MSSASSARAAPGPSAFRATADAAAPQWPAPHCLALEPKEPGPEVGPPVRLFLGTEGAQYRAERIFLWSIEQVRHPRRRYEIYLMRHLAGFRRLGWTTQFTNHRFAVPHYAGGQGRALYNDVDQIYLRDPGELFDLPLDGHGYLAIAERETSVMLLDCQRMAEVWSLEDAQRRSKRWMIARALAVPGLFGPLDGAWNCRDEDEYEPGGTACYHFTTLHTQPWRPFPDRFVYHEHPHRRLWWDLRASADRAGYHPFDRERPSPGFAAVDPERSPAPGPGRASMALRGWLRRLSPRAVRVFALGTGQPVEGLSELGLSGPRMGDLLSLADPEPEGEKDELALCPAGLDAVPDDDLPWVVDALFERGPGGVVAVARLRAPERRAPWWPPAGEVRRATWWRDLFEIASRRRPDRPWKLFLLDEAGELAAAPWGGAWAFPEAPRVALLFDAAPGAEARGRALADALGWPTRDWPLRHGPVDRALQGLLGSGAWGEWAGRQAVGADREALADAPAPDLVIASGATTAPLARWLRDRSRGAVRVVQLDADGASPADDFDLVVSDAGAGALAHPRRLEIEGWADLEAPDAGSGPPPTRRGRWARLAFSKPHNDRGTTRPQMGPERFVSRLVARGMVLPPPQEGVPRSAAGPPAMDDLAQRVRGLLGEPAHP